MNILYSNLGLIENLLKNLEKSEEYYIKSLEFGESPLIKNNLGGLYLENGKTDLGLKFLNDPLNDFEKETSKFNSQYPHIQLAKYYLWEDRNENSIKIGIKHIEKAFEIAVTVNDFNVAAESAKILGDEEFDQGNFKTAKANYLNSLDFVKKLSFLKQEYMLLISLGNTCVELKEYHEAELNYQEAIELGISNFFERSEFVTIIWVYLL